MKELIKWHKNDHCPHILYSVSFVYKHANIHANVLNVYMQGFFLRRTDLTTGEYLFK